MIVAVYFFTDEAEQLYLPYRTEAEAKEAETIYARVLTLGWELLSTADKLKWDELATNNIDLCRAIHQAIG